MAKIKLHDDGWLSLPEDLRQGVGLSTGAQVEVELVDGAIMLRPASKDPQPKRHEETPVEAPAANGEERFSPAADMAPVKRRPGRPRKTVPTVELAAAPDAAQRMVGSAKRKPEPTRAPDPADRPLFTIGPSKLLKKADLPPKAVQTEPALLAASAFKRASQDSGFRFEERRPFRQVEVRKLGPGRGHHQPRRRAFEPAI